MALESSNKSWSLVFSDGAKRRQVSVPAANCYTLEELGRLGITPGSVIEKLAGSFKGWLCADGDQVVGFSMADRAIGELWVIAVLPECEGKGIGNKLMSLAEEWLAACGCARAWLTTDPDRKLRAHGFYRQRGWTQWKVEDGRLWPELALSIRESWVCPRISAATVGAFCHR